MSISPKKAVNDAILKEISDVVDSLEYGEMTIKVHNRRVIQIEVTKKKRFDDIWKIEGGGGI